MSSFAPKTTSLQAYQMALYRNAIHPEFFQIQGRRRVAHADYEFEVWIWNGGHAVRFEYGDHCINEIVSDFADDLPQGGLVTALPCAGEKDHETDMNEAIGFMTSIQTETLTDHLYLSTYEELVDFGRNSDCLMSFWKENGKNNLSLVDFQKYRDQVHVQTYHLRSDCGLVLRTQSIFQIGEADQED